MAKGKDKIYTPPWSKSESSNGSPPTIYPALDTMLIQVLPQSEHRVGKIILPDGSRREAYREGIIIAVGPGRLLDDVLNGPTDLTTTRAETVPTHRPIIYKEGQRILFDYPASLLLDHSYWPNRETELVILREEGVFAVLDYSENKRVPKEGQRILFDTDASADGT